MTWLPAPSASCVHVACADLDECAYQPPAVGPDLPECIIAADGSAWTRHGGSLFYSGKPGGGYLIATPAEIVRALVATEPMHSLAIFPLGQWWDGHQTQTPERRAAHEAWQATFRRETVTA